MKYYSILFIIIFITGCVNKKIMSISHSERLFSIGDPNIPFYNIIELLPNSNIQKLLDSIVGWNHIVKVYQGKRTAIFKVGCFTGCTHSSFAYFIFSYSHGAYLVKDYTNLKFNLKQLNKIDKCDEIPHKEKFNLIDDIELQILTNKSYERSKGKTF